MKGFIQSVVSMLCILVLLLGCTTQAAMDEGAAPPQDRVAPPVKVVAEVSWCDTSAPRLQTAVFQAMGVLPRDAESLELSFRTMLGAFREAQPDAPVEIAVTMTSAIENLEDLIRLMEEFDWDRTVVDADRLNRIDGRFEGALWALDTFTIQECDLASGLFLPSNVDPGPADWCDGRATQLGRTILHAVTLDTDDPSTFEDVYVDLALTLRNAESSVPPELEVIMAVTTDNLDAVIDYLIETDWDLRETHEELLFLNYDFLETLGRLDEYNVIECGLESTLVLPALPALDPFEPPEDSFEQPDPDRPTTTDLDPAQLEGVIQAILNMGLARTEAECFADNYLLGELFGDGDTRDEQRSLFEALAECGVSEERRIELFGERGTGFDVPTFARPEVSGQRSDVDSWRGLATTPGIGIRDRLTQIAPFPTSHVVNASQITSLSIDYVPSHGSPDVRVHLTYRSNSNVDETVFFVTETMLEQEGTVQITESDNGDITAESEPLNYPTSVHTVVFHAVGDETDVEATFTIGSPSPETEARLRELIAGWHRDTWPDAPGTTLGWAQASYEWSSAFGISVRTGSDHFIAEGTDPVEAWDRFRDGFGRSTTEWVERDPGSGSTVLITPDEADCVLLSVEAVSYIYVYDEGLPNLSCWP